MSQSHTKTNVPSHHTLLLKQLIRLAIEFLKRMFTFNYFSIDILFFFLLFLIVEEPKMCINHSVSECECFLLYSHLNNQRQHTKKNTNQ